MVPTGFVVGWPNGVNFSTTTLSPDTGFTVYTEQLDPTTLAYAGGLGQAVRAGVTISVPVVSSDPSVGSITVSPSMGPPVSLTITSFDYVMLLQWPWDPIPCVLETTTDWTSPFSWYPIGQDAFIDEFGMMNAYVDVLSDTQCYRLRRIP